MLKNNKILQVVYCTFGAFLMALAVVCVFDQIGIVAGGVTGTAIILKKLFRVPMWLVSFLFNAPLFVIGFRILDRRNFAKTVYTTVMLTLFLGVVPVFDIVTGNIVVDVILGSLIMGSGLGLIFLSNASSGGTDLAATLLKQKFKNISIPQIMLIIDSIIVSFGIGIFGIEKGIFAIIAIIIVERLCDFILEGPNKAKLMYIISDKNDIVLAYIVDEINRGVTIIDAQGAYSGTGKKMIMSVVSGREMVKIRQKVYEIDDFAICFICDIRQAFGEGFTKIG